MKKRLLCYGVVLIGGGFTFMPSATVPPPPTVEPKNIILIIADDLGQEDLGCYGNPFNETPHLDQLAQRGIRFTQAYSASPVCSPSRAALMTGKHPARLKLTNYLGGERKEEDSPLLPANWVRSLAGTEQTLAEKCKEKGYATGMVGKWHLGGGKGESPWEQGFDFTRMIGKNGLDYYNYSIFEDSYQREVKDNGTYYLTDRLTDYATEFIDKQIPGKPYFLYVAYSAPHVLLVPRGDKVGKYLWKYEKHGRQFNPYYAAMIESIDDGLGKIVSKLKEKNQLENTVLVFTSDNGFVGLPELGPTPNGVSQYRKWKGHLYEGGIRIPLIMSSPAQWPSQVSCSNPVLNTDFFNTFSEILGDSPQPNLDSKSFYASLLNPAKPASKRDMFWHYPHFSNQLGRPFAAVRSGDWKLVKNYETEQLELFDLANDVAEKNNLALSNPSKTTELHQLLLQRLREVDANMPIKK